MALKIHWHNRSTEVIGCWLTTDSGASVVSSRELADVVGDALGISRASAQLHLKTIRAGGQILFAGYGRAAAEMTSLEAARLVLACAGSTFAKDSMEVLKRFAHLRPAGSKKSSISLEQFLSGRIAELPMYVQPEQRERGLGRSFGSRRLAQTALQLYEPIGEKVEELPRFAVVRWLEEKGHSKLKIFGPAMRLVARGRHSANAPEDEDDLPGAGEFHHVLGQYSDHTLFQVRAVARTALIEIGAALKGATADYGNETG
ncbi:hypothetical protein [Bradyrhizobium sp. 17]|uniref:hypothetical protein n=1 Tax=Bradyrhizobium sp. 17 TaxID=2782649 RepID=UPI001FFB3D5F|nr:hypothetical protein [Bradyrhizobium sp. 17]MCK1525443.1 hypothetical protein [Bradyrhizobium sp. 17]